MGVESVGLCRGPQRLKIELEMLAHVTGVMLHEETVNERIGR